MTNLLPDRVRQQLLTLISTGTVIHYGFDLPSSSCQLQHTCDAWFLAMFTVRGSDFKHLSEIHDVN